MQLRHLDGDLAELGLAVWRELAPEPIAPPEDCTGPLDHMECDDLGCSETGMQDADWVEALEGHAEPEGEEPLPRADTLLRWQRRSGIKSPPHPGGRS